MFTPFVGMQLRPKDHVRERDDETAEIIGHDLWTGEWRVCVANTFSANVTAERVNADYDPIVWIQFSSPLYGGNDDYAVFGLVDARKEVEDHIKQGLGFVVGPG